MSMHEDYVYAVMADRRREADTARLARRAAGARRRGHGSIVAQLARLLIR